jgi:hypothetical protein
MVERLIRQRVVRIYILGSANKYARNACRVFLHRTVFYQGALMTARPTVTFETKCWERDWKLIMRTGRLRRMIEACAYPFAERVLYVNNVRDPVTVMKAAQDLVNDGTITRAMAVEDAAEEALDRAGISRESFKGGYYYSIQELVGIFQCTSDYLLHFSGDSIQTSSEQWIDAAIGRMEHDRSVAAANPNWDGGGRQAEQEAHSEDGEFFRSRGFSDQCYLIRPEVFRQHIYGETNEATRVYPRYGGELFEKRVNAWMRNHGLDRLTSKKACYAHRNFPKDPLRRWVMYRFGVNLKK